MKNSRPLEIQLDLAAQANKLKWLLGIALVCMTLLAYLPVLGCGYIWDDDFYVTANPCLINLGGLFDIWFKMGATPQYYPLVHSTYWVEYHLWGLNPMGYHIVNVLLHLGSSLLIWRFLVMLKMRWQWAWLAAALFALHPVQVESVAWITERKNVLSCLFYLLAAINYWRFDQSRHVRHWSLALFCFVLALLSKTVVATLPALMLVIIWQQRGRIRLRKDVLPTLPFFAIGITMGLMTAWLEKVHVGAQGHQWNHDFVQRVLLAGRAVCFYVSKLVWPVNLSFVYLRWEVDPAIWWQWLFPVMVLAVILLSFVYARRTDRRFVLACLLGFVGTLFPALGFIDVFPFRYSFVADHFQYHASLGMLVLLAVILGRLFAKARWVIALLLVILCGLTAMQSLNYTNEQTLWEATIKTNPDAWLARNNLAILLRQRGELDAVKQLIGEAIQRTPNAIEPRLNMGQLMMELGRPAQAVTHFKVVLKQIFDDRRALIGIARALEQVGQKQEANVYFKQVVTVYEKSPRFLNSPRGWMNYARALEGTGALEQAIQRYELGAQKFSGTTAQAYQRIGIIALKRGQIQQALGAFERSARAGQSASVESIQHWAWILATHPDNQFRDGKKALQLAVQICKFTQNRAPRYLDTLAAGFAQVGQYQQAITVEQQAIGLAEQAGFSELVDAMKSRLALYQKHQPYRDASLSVKD